MSNAQRSNPKYWISSLALATLRKSRRHAVSNLRISGDTVAKKKREEPSLVTEAVTVASGPDGIPDRVIIRRRRGFLSDVEIRKVEPKLHDLPLNPDGKAALLALCEELRGHLDSLGLETDKWEVMPLERDWGYDPKEHGVVADEDLWMEQVEESTEPLTKARIAAELLHTVLRLLRTCNEEQLGDIFKAMSLYHLNSTAGELHALALAAEGAKKGRAHGPPAKANETLLLRERILSIAKDFWGRHPELQGRPTTTGNRIVKLVNKAIKTEWPGRKVLAAKTITDHLRTALRGSPKR